MGKRPLLEPRSDLQIITLKPRIRVRINMRTGQFGYHDPLTDRWETGESVAKVRATLIP